MSTPKPISPFRLCSLLRLEKDPNLALHLFQNPNPQSPKPQKPFRYTLRCYDLITAKLGRAKMFQQMDQILTQLNQESRFSPTEIIFCNVISFYGRARLPHRALQVFDQIPSFRCRRTVKSYNSLLDALLKCGEIEKIRELFENVENYATPDACTYNILINACCSYGCLDDAWKVFDEMCVRGVRPNVVTFGTLVYGLCVNSRLVEALRLKEDMMRFYGVKPNGLLYTSLIRGLCRTGELNLAFRLKEEMEINKIKPDSAVYNTFISALSKIGKKEEAFRVLEEMRESGCKPDTVTYNSMLHGFCREKDFESAYKVLVQMVKEGCKPDIISYNVIIGGLCKEGKFDEANDLFEDLPRRGCTPDVVSYRTIFDGFCDQKRFKEATLILDEMIFKGFSPSSASFHKLVDGLCQKRNMELLWKVLASIGNAKVIDVDTWKLVISIASKKEMLSNASALVDTLLVA